MRIDSHHHLWRYRAEDYAWIDDRMQPLRRDFLLDDLLQVMQAARVDATVVVQARQTLEETDWLLQIAEGSDVIVGVVGWAPIASPQFPAILDRLRRKRLLKGIRHVVQAEPPGFLDRTALNAGIETLTGSGLVYDLLLRSSQLDESIRFIDRHPRQSFVVDHLAKPDIAGNALDVWAAKMCELARRENVVCKLSGMVTEADWTRWSVAELTPYFEAVLNCFGPSRLMAGSDWPVLSVACDYLRWWEIIGSWTSTLSSFEREQIEGGTACRTYGIAADRHERKI